MPRGQVEAASLRRLCGCADAVKTDMARADIWSILSAAAKPGLGSIFGSMEVQPCWIDTGDHHLCELGTMPFQKASSLKSTCSQVLRQRWAHHCSACRSSSQCSAPGRCSRGLASGRTTVAFSQRKLPLWRCWQLCSRPLPYPLR